MPRKINVNDEFQSGLFGVLRLLGPQASRLPKRANARLCSRAHSGLKELATLLALLRSLQAGRLRSQRLASSLVDALKPKT